MSTHGLLVASCCWSPTAPMASPASEVDYLAILHSEFYVLLLFVLFYMLLSIV